MPLSFERNDITAVKCGAAVVPVGSRRDGGILSAFKAAGGRRLSSAICHAGGSAAENPSVIRTPYLNADFLILVQTPQADGPEPEKALYDCYAAALDAAKLRTEKGVVIPVIGAGVNGYSARSAFDTAVGACRDYLSENELSITIVVNDKAPFLHGRRILSDVSGYIAENEAYNAVYAQAAEPFVHAKRKKAAAAPAVYGAAAFWEEAAPRESLEEYLKNADEGFSQTLLKLIDRSGMTDVECYKRANVDRKLFSKIRSDPGYRPKKTTALSFCIALSLSLEETNSLLSRAGYALSHSSRADLIVEYFIKNGKYDIFEINEALFEFDQALLGV